MIVNPLSRFPRLRKGFTLVELAIVLVIVGLLIGGVLVAQSMIQSAKLQRLVRDVSAYEIMFRNFKTRYGEWPGDSRIFNPPGDGDGRIGNATGGYSSEYSGELAAVWPHLQQAKILNDGKLYTEVRPVNDCPTNQGATPNFPTLSWSDNAGILLVMGDGAGSPSAGYFRLADFTNAPFDNFTTGGVNDIFTPAQAYAIDFKLDDGRNTTIGNVFAEDGGSRATCGSPPVDSYPAYDCRFNNAYDTSVDAIDCHLMIKWLPNER